MGYDHAKYLSEVESHWRAAIRAVGATNVPSQTWTGTGQIAAALRPFLGSNVNHALYPTGGGLDWRAEGTTSEHGCLAILPEDKMADIFKPASMTLEHFPNHVLESFLLIDLAPLAADPASADPYGSQELVELPGRGYRDRGVWDEGHLGHDEQGREIPFPPGTRLVTRWLGGKILLVAKGSTWNSIPATYSGQHNGMTSGQIRDIIEKMMARA